MDTSAGYPPEYSGSGSGYVSYALVIEQLARASMTVGAIVAVSILSQESLFRFGSEARRRSSCTLVEGNILGCFCFTEPATGPIRRPWRRRRSSTAGIM